MIELGYLEFFGLIAGATYVGTLGYGLTMQWLTGIINRRRWRKLEAQARIDALTIAQALAEQTRPERRAN